MQRCVSVQVAGTNHTVERCIYCGKFTVESPPPNNECSGGIEPLGTTKMLTPAARLTNFTIAAAKHLAHGSPECQPLQIATRFSKCTVCPHYNPVLGACSLCGCLVNLNAADEGWNALAWADKECPDKPPRFTKIAS